MKKLILILTTVFTVSTLTFAEGTEVAHQAATFNVFGPIVNYWGGSYEGAVTDHFSIKGELGLSPNVAWVTGLGLASGKVEGRYYFGEAVDGWYLGAGAMASTFWGEVTSGDITTTFSGFLPGLGVYGGTKWIFSKKDSLFLEPFLGYEVFFGSVSAKAEDQFGNKASATADVPAVGGFAFGIGFGWAF